MSRNKRIQPHSCDTQKKIEWQYSPLQAAPVKKQHFEPAHNGKVGGDHSLTTFFFDLWFLRLRNFVMFAPCR